MNKPQFAPIFAMLLLGLSGCNSGGDGGGDTSSGTGSLETGAVGTPGYDYFVADHMLMAVDRMNADKPAFAVTPLSDTSIFGLNRWFFTVRNPDNRIGIDYRNAAMLFVNNHVLYRLDASGSYAGKPRRVSTFLDSQRCWELDPEQLVSQLDQAQIKLMVAGSDGKCSTADDDYRVIKLGMGENDAPELISRQQFFSKEIRNSQGGVIGYLSWEGKDIIAYDSQFGNPRGVIKGIGGPVEHAWRFAQRVAGRFDLVDAELTNNMRAILALDMQTGDAKLLATVPLSGSRYWGVQDGFVYFTSGYTKLVRMRLDSASGAEDVLSFSGRLLGIDGGRVVVDEGAGAKSGRVVSYELANRSRSVVISPNVLIDGEPIVAEGRLYYSAKPETVAQSRSAVSVSVIGTDPVVYPDAKWIGAAAKQGGYSDSNRYSYWSGLSQVYLGSQMSRDTQGKWHVSNIDAVDTATGRVVASLGKPPTDALLLNVRSVNDSGVVLGYGSSSESSTSTDASYYYWLLDGRSGTIRQVGTTTTSGSGNGSYTSSGYYNWGWFTDWFGFR